MLSRFKYSWYKTPPTLKHENEIRGLTLKTSYTLGEFIDLNYLFENEAELFHICQLADLISYQSIKRYPRLICPYLPYARQDKLISNNSSFALNTFLSVIASKISFLKTYDAHSDTGSEIIESTQPTDFHKSVFNHDIACFPDKGAVTRYGTNFADRAPVIHCEKVRDQLTGNILGLNVMNNGVDIEGKTILIVDDICDGGMTFIKVAEVLHQFKPKQVDLAVSHGLFTKGKQCLHDAGITNIYTTNSLLRNPEGFKVW
jgi:ribose-phosphate pyrophosphokinase